MTSVRRALALSFTERYLLMVLALASSIIIARLLTPEQIGIYSVSLALIGIAQVLRDFGIGNFLIQEKNLSDDHIRTAFGLSLLLGGALFVIVFLAAPWAGGFYGEPSMIDTVRIVAVNFLVLPFCTISLALLRRDMQFQRLLYVHVSAGVVGFVVTISLAYAGQGPNSMAIGMVATNMVTGFGAWIARPERQLLRPALTEWRSIARFGGQSSLIGVVTTISMDANDLIVGKVLGFHSVAIISRAQGLMNLFHQGVMSTARSVALPAFAAAYRRDEDLAAPYAQSIANVTAIAWPFYGLVSLYPLELLRLLYGPQWDSTAPLVPIFCASGALAAIVGLAPVLLVSLGRIDLVTRAELTLQPMRVILVALAAVVWRDPMVVSFAFLASTMVATPVFWILARRVLRSSNRALWSGVLTSMWVSVAALFPAVIHNVIRGASRTQPLSLAEVVTVMVICAGAWLAAAKLLDHSLASEPWFVPVFEFVSRVRGWWQRG